MEDGENEEDDALGDSMDKINEVQLRKHSTTDRPNGRAPTITIEAVRIGRPVKVMSLLSSVVSLLCFTISVASTTWMYNDAIRTGLYLQCDLSTNNIPEVSSDTICASVLTDSWERLTCALLGPTALLLNLIGIGLFIGGMLTMIVRQKVALYSSVIVFYTLANIAMLTTIIILPISVNKTNAVKENANGGTRNATLGWAYILTLCGLCALVVAIILLLLDRKGDEVAYREYIYRPQS